MNMNFQRLDGVELARQERERLRNSASRFRFRFRYVLVPTMVGAFTYYFLSGSIAALVAGASAVVLGVFISLVKMGYYVLDNCDL